MDREAVRTHQSVPPSSGDFGVWDLGFFDSFLVRCQFSFFYWADGHPCLIFPSPSVLNQFSSLFSTYVCLCTYMCTFSVCLPILLSLALCLSLFFCLFVSVSL